MIGKLKKSSLILLVAITFLLAATPVYAQATSTKAGRAHIARSRIVKLKHIPVQLGVSSYVKRSLIVKLDKAISKIDMALVYMEMGITLCDLYLRMAKGAMYEFITIVRSSMFFTAIPGDLGEQLISIAIVTTHHIQLAIETPL